LRTEVKAGYRSPYLIELTREIVDGELNIKSWLDNSRDSSWLKREIMKIKGVGDYSANNILKILGRYDFLALDSWLRRRFAQIRNKG